MTVEIDDMGTAIDLTRQIVNDSFPGSKIGDKHPEVVALIYLASSIERAANKLCESIGRLSDGSWENEGMREAAEIVASALRGEAKVPSNYPVSGDDTEDDSARSK